MKEGLERELEEIQSKLDYINMLSDILKKIHYLKNSIIYSVNSKNIIWKTLNPVTNTKQFLIVFHFL